MSDEQTHEELRAHYAPTGPVAAALRFFEAARSDDSLDAVWEHAAPQFRCELAAGWVQANLSHPLLIGRDPEEVTQELARGNVGHLLWPGFEITQLDEFRTQWGDIDLQRWGFASRPRPLAPNYELVLLVDTGRKRGPDDEPFQVEGPTLVHAIGFVLENTDAGWLVAELTNGDAGSFAEAA